MNFKRGAKAVYKNDGKLELAKQQKNTRSNMMKKQKKDMGKQNTITDEKGMLQ